MEKKKNIVLVLLFIVIGVMTCFGIKMSKEIVELKQENNSTNINENNNQSQSNQQKEQINQQEKNNILNNNQNNTINNTNDTRNDYKVISFDKTKCINCDNNFSEMDISLDVNSANWDGLYFYVKNDNRKIVEVDARYWQIDPYNYPEEEIMKDLSKTNEWSVKKKIYFDKNVEMVFAGVFHPDFSEGLEYFFLLDDGTLEYMDFREVLNNKKFEIKKIKDVTNVIRFSNISYGAYNSTGSTYTTIAYRSDGSYYDLSKFVSFN